MASGIFRSILVCVFSLASCSAFAQGVGGFRAGTATPLRPMPYPAVGAPGLATPPARLAAPGPVRPGLAMPTLGSLPGGRAPYSGAAGSGASGSQQRAIAAQDAIAEVQADLDSSRGDDIYSLPVVEKFRRAGGQ
jgi:hypothetical protein